VKRWAKEEKLGGKPQKSNEKPGGLNKNLRQDIGRLAVREKHPKQW